MTEKDERVIPAGLIAVLVLAGWLYWRRRTLRGPAL